MPKKKVTITYSCNICSDEFNNKESAIECENSGVALPEFIRGEVVELIHFPQNGQKIEVSSGYKILVKNETKGIIQFYWLSYKDKRYNPHELPCYYEIWFATPGGPYKAEISSINRKFLKKTVAKDDAKCPLCETKSNLIENMAYTPLGFDTYLPIIRKVLINRCSNCDSQFFTDNQLKNTKLTINKEMKWKLVDTAKLIKEGKFQY